LVNIEEEEEVLEKMENFTVRNTVTLPREIEQTVI
jgi:hypothetical protein